MDGEDYVQDPETITVAETGEIRLTDEPVIVEATLTVSAHPNRGASQRKEAAMAAAVLQCMEDGISLPVTMRERITAASKRTK